MSDYAQLVDEIDRFLLKELQQNGTLSNVELARRVSLSPPAVHARVRRLETLGYIRRYAALLDREKVGYDLLCIVSVTLRWHEIEHIRVFKEAIQQMPEVLECFFVTGDADYLLKVVARNRKELEQFLTQKLTPIAGVGRVSTSVVLDELKNTVILNVE